MIEMECKSTMKRHAFVHRVLVAVDRRGWTERCSGRQSGDGQAGLQGCVAQVDASEGFHALRGLQGSRFTIEEQYVAQCSRSDSSD